MNTYQFKGKEDVEIIVGDEKQENFYPRMKIKRWDNEVNFSVGVISAYDGTDSNITDKVEWDDGHGTKARFYEKEGDEFEFEIELASKPLSNVLHLSIETNGLDFFYQPALTHEELNDTVIVDEKEVCRYNRPDNVIGSYAVYHSTAAGNHIGGNNYRSGITFHIYRPCAIDSKGTKVWCGLHIDTDMEITIPQDFIDNAVYPIIVDPTFGCDPDTPGSSSFFPTDDGTVIYGSLFTSPSNMDTVQSMTVRCTDFTYSTTWGASVFAKGVIVLHSTLNIVSNGITAGLGLDYNTDGLWQTHTFGTDPSLSASTEYVLMWICYDSGGGDLGKLWYNSGSSNQGHIDTSNSYTSPSNPTDATHDNNKYSIYCTYTALATGTRTPRVFLGPFGGPFGGPI